MQELAEASTSEGKVIIEWAGTFEKTIYMLHIRNSGSAVLDIRGYGIGAGACEAAGETPLTLVRGSFDLAPGEAALIITHSGIPLDDEPRLSYSNLLVYSGPRLRTDNGDNLAFLPIRGAGADIPLGAIMADPAVGECCEPAVGADCCSAFGGCAVGNGACWVQVTKAWCCGTTNACG